MSARAFLHALYGFMTENMNQEEVDDLDASLAEPIDERSSAEDRIAAVIAMGGVIG
jgi:hypothetical protein